MSIPANVYNLRPRYRGIKNEQPNDDEGDGAPPDTENNKRKGESSEKKNNLKHMRSSTRASVINPNTTDGIEDQPDDHLTSLPLEIILYILHYLHLRDRKNTRLTCKLLNESLKHISFAKREKFVFTGSRRVSTSLIREMLVRTTCSYLNLEFRGPYARTSSLSADVLKMCGDQVRSISYHHCFPEARTLENIFLFCSNLEVITFNKLFSGWKERKLATDFERALNNLILMKVERIHLHTITFNCGRSINGRLLRKISIIFPNLRHLHASFYRMGQTTECLKPFVQLQSLSCNVRGSERVFWLELWNVPELPMRLTEFRTVLHTLCLDVRDSMRSSLFRFVAAQTGLEIFSLEIPEGCPIHRPTAAWRKPLMFHILKSCRKLREFTFSLHPDTCFDTVDEVAEYMDLISNLRFLKVKYLPEIADGLSLPSTARTNLALDGLQTGAVTSSRSEWLLRHILKHCPNMQHLLLHDTPLDDELLVICRSMPKLRTLRVRASFSDAFDPAEGFQNLEYLEVRASCFAELPIRLLQKIKFRRLKHLKLTIYFSFSTRLRLQEIDGLREMLWNMPTLETVELSQLTLVNRYELMEAFKNLKHLCCLICRNVEGYNVEHLFKACPYLRFVSAGWLTFTYDSLTKRVISEEALTLEEQGVFNFSYKSE